MHAEPVTDPAGGEIVADWERVRASGLRLGAFRTELDFKLARRGTRMGESRRNSWAVDLKRRCWNLVGERL